MTSWLSRIHQLIRRLRHAPMFTAVTVLTLAIGIGANIAIFTVVDSVILKPLPYLSSDRLVAVTYNAAGMATFANFVGMAFGVLAFRRLMVPHFGVALAWFAFFKFVVGFIALYAFRAETPAAAG